MNRFTLLSFVFCGMIGVHATAQNRADLIDLPQRLKSEVQSGYLEIDNSVKNAGGKSGVRQTYKDKVYFFRSETGGLNYIIESGSWIYLRNGNTDKCFYKQDDVFKEKLEFTSPTNINRGLIPIWLNDSFLAPLVRNDRFKNSQVGELTFLTYKGLIDRELQKSTVIEFGFKGIYPVYTRTSIPGRNSTQISISRLMDFKLNPYTKESFDTLFFETLVKIFRPAPGKPRERFLEANPQIYDLAGDVIKEDWKKLNMIVMLPQDAPSMDVLSNELKRINIKYPNEVKILPIASGKDHPPSIPAEMKSMFGVFTIDPQYQWNNSLYSHVVLIVIFDENQKIITTMNWLQSSDGEKLMKAVQEILK